MIEPSLFVAWITLGESPDTTALVPLTISGCLIFLIMTIGVPNLSFISCDGRHPMSIELRNSVGKSGAPSSVMDVSMDLVVY